MKLIEIYKALRDKIVKTIHNNSFFDIVVAVIILSVISIIFSLSLGIILEFFH